MRARRRYGEEFRRQVCEEYLSERAEVAQLSFLENQELRSIWLCNLNPQTTVRGPISIAKTYCDP